MKPRTLLGHLLGWTLGSFAFVWLGFTLVGFRTGLHEADELTDGHLASVASLLLSQSSNQFESEREHLAAEATHPSMLAHDYQQSMSVVVWDAQGRVQSSTGTAPLPPFGVPDGFATLQLGQPPTAWRTFARWKAPDRSRRVMVLLSIAERDALAWDIGAQVASPVLWFLPVLALVLGLAIRRGLQPLTNLTGEVNALDVQRAMPLAPGDRPKEFKAVVDAINTLVERYRSALSREQQLASELAHELRTPLASLSLHAGALAGPLSDEERRSSLRQLESDALRAGKLLDELLTLARASRTEMAEAATPVDLVTLAQSVVGEYGQAALDSGHEIGLEAPAPWTVAGHPVLLEIALRNLLDNALSHTPTGSTVEVQLDAEARWLQVSDDGMRVEGPDGRTGRRVTGRSPTGPRVLGFGLGHRVIDKIAAVHGATFGPVPAPEGFSTSYRITFAERSSFVSPTHEEVA